MLKTQVTPTLVEHLRTAMSVSASIAMFVPDGVGCLGSRSRTYIVPGGFQYSGSESGGVLVCGIGVCGRKLYLNHPLRKPLAKSCLEPYGGPLLLLLQLPSPLCLHMYLPTTRTRTHIRGPIARIPVRTFRVAYASISLSCPATAACVSSSSSFLSAGPVHPVAACRTTTMSASAVAHWKRIAKASP
jgi:hypothetical protein